MSEFSFGGRGREGGLFGVREERGIVGEACFFADFFLPEGLGGVWEGVGSVGWERRGLGGTWRIGL